jgi:D-3-phosphoglycerate dehydrogenase
VHRNIPGIMSAINQIFSDFNINVAAQYLQTNAKVGYVVVDIEAEYSDDAIASLKAIEGTIRCRVLF